MIARVPLALALTLAVVAVTERVAATADNHATALAAWRSFRQAHGTAWQVQWNQRTRVPARIFGPGLAYPGSMRSGQVAEAAAIALLEKHIDLLAPGARASDFTVVSNRMGSAMRVVGLAQSAGGIAVAGGQLSFRFKSDRLFVIASQALPHVPPLSGTIVSHRAAQHARDAMTGALGGSWQARPGPMQIVPVTRAGGIDYRLTRRVEVERRRPFDRRLVWIDVDTGAIVAEKSQLSSATSTVAFRVPVRWPGGDRDLYPARRVEVMVDGQAGTTGQAGDIGWNDADPGSCQTTVTGPEVAVHNAAGDLATEVLQLVDQDTAIWDAGSSEYTDAQLTTFIHASVAKDHARTIDPSMEWLGSPLSATVNMDQDCNALSDGSSIYFFRSDDQCHNTGRLADIVYHEVGHVLHRQSIVPGVGAFDAALSEGASDYFSASITGDPVISPGFYKSGQRLRHIDPIGSEARWPEDIGELPHDTGLIFAGAMWDLRKALIAELGDDDGAVHADQLFYAAIRHAVDIPSTYFEVLAADDDDGDLTNGTPNRCSIDAAFAAHGLADPTLLGSVGPPMLEGTTITVPFTDPDPRCGERTVQSMTVWWRITGADSLSQLDLTEATPGAYSAALPPMAEGSAIDYRVDITYADATTESLPTNPAAPFYQLYLGEVTELYCTDFELPPSQEGWRTYAEPEPNEWTWGQPESSQGRGGDPLAAFSGTYVLGTDLGGFDKDAVYEPNTETFALSPVVPVPTSAQSIRLQYRRWLRVQDGARDRARIISNDHEVWSNAQADGDLVHADAEWRFHDVDLTHTVQGGTVQIGFELASDSEVELGGWNLDDVCIVAFPALCQGDECGCPDGECHEPRPADCGCNSSGGSALAGALVVWAALLGLGRRRRQVEVEGRRGAG